MIPTINLASGRKIQLSSIALIHFLATAADAAEVHYRNAPSEVIVGANDVLKAATSDFFNYNGVSGAGPDATYTGTRVNPLATVSAGPTGASAVTAYVENVGTIVLDRGDPEYVGQLMQIIMN